MITLNDIKNFEEATQQELKEIRGIIYLIINKVNGKCYIGKSINSFYKRYPNRPFWYIKHHNNILLNSINHYGINNFKICLLEKNILDEEFLYFMETVYISLFNSRHPNGFNLYLSETSNKEKIKKIRKSQTKFSSRNYKLIDYQGKIYNIFNLKNFCNKNNLSYHGMRCMVCGNNEYSQGFTLFKNDINYKNIPKPLKLRKYIVVDPNGNEYTISGNSRPFLLKHNLPNFFYQMLTGRIKSCLGWKLKTPTEFKGKRKTHRIHLLKLQYQDGTIKEFKNIEDVVQKLNLHRRQIYNLINKKINNLHGWILLEIQRTKYNY